MKKAFITGITGQDGYFLAKFLLAKGYEIHGLIRRRSKYDIAIELSDLAQVSGYSDNLTFHYGDLNDTAALYSIINDIRPDEIYNLAGQSHVGLSFEQIEYTTDTLANGTLRLLQANRKTKTMAKFYQASSSEIFGDPVEIPQNENTPLKPVTPYGVSKAFAHNMANVFRISYEMFVCSGIMYNHESIRRSNDYITKKICQGAARIKMGLQNHLKLGNLNAKRDWGYAPEYVEAMWLMLQRSKPENYVIATGEQHSVREIVEIAFEKVNLDWHDFIEEDPKLFRPNDPNRLVGNFTQAKKKLGWRPRKKFEDIIREIMDHEINNIKHTTQ